ncbi:hypothetical protein Nepgr_016550 [Nepenthes gracilis]|uniref:E3 ubiquitin-protein ligase FANCL n=1 Tax=Nepenthes gracilis TaxID=150966 RepID=A0AAD3SPX1_NEPGR|nr:hypothetical protein Nepgr_016550 [Nepenthes gracilis]
MDLRLEMTQARCSDLAATSSFYRLVYSEIEECGWERLIWLSDDLSCLSFRIMDKKKRGHILEIRLDKSYPSCPPSIAADVPHIFNLKWSTNSRLKDVLRQFSEHLEKLQGFWDSLENIDKCLSVVGLEQQSHANSYRQINIGNDCCLILNIDANDPRSLPECRFMGSDHLVNSFRNKWRRNNKKWSKDQPLSVNLAIILETRLPGPRDAERDDQKFECGICYAQFLPTDEGFGDKSGCRTDYTCENANCGRAFHSICVGEWLQSITTTRRSYDFLFGNCPYCSEPVSVRINTKCE